MERIIYGGSKLSKQKKRKKRKKPAGVVLFSIIVLVITAFVVFRFEALAGNAWDLSGSGSGLTGSIAADYKVGYEDQTVFHIEEGYVLKTGDGVIRFYDTSAEPVWEKDLNGQNVLVDGNEKSISVVNQTAGDLFLLNTDGEITAKKFGVGQIGEVLHPSSDVLVCYMVEENELRIFDAGLENIARIPMPDGEILDLDVSSTDSLIAVSMFRLEDEAYHSQILTYQLDGQAIGAINMKDKIILDIEVAGTQMIGVTDEQAFAYNTSNELLWDINIDRTIKKASVSKDGMILLNLVRSSEDLTDIRPENALQYINEKGEEVNEIAIEYDAEVMIFKGSRTVFSTEDRLYILSNSGKMESIIDTGGNLRSFNFISDKYLGVEFGDRLDILKMD